MRCIENHPTRNSLVSGNAVSGSTRTLQLKIEALKKELALRDAMCGYAMYTNPSSSSSSASIPSIPPSSFAASNTINGNNGNNILERPPILDTLTKVQHTNCQKMISQFVLSGSDKYLDVRSIAEVKVLANYLRTALWNACGGDQDTVLEILKNSTTNGGDFLNDMFQDDNLMTERRSSSYPQQSNSIQEGIQEDEENGENGENGEEGNNTEREERNQTQIEMTQNDQERIRNKKRIINK